jgi:hypothetical protein
MVKGPWQTWRRRACLATVSLALLALGKPLQAVLHFQHEQLRTLLPSCCWITGFSPSFLNADQLVYLIFHPPKDTRIDLQGGEEIYD